jgi:hypothetical protein
LWCKIVAPTTTVAATVGTMAMAGVYVVVVAGIVFGESLPRRKKWVAIILLYLEEKGNFLPCLVTVKWLKVCLESRMQ